MDNVEISTTVRINLSTKKRIQANGTAADSIDDIINRGMELLEKKVKAKS